MSSLTMAVRCTETAMGESVAVVGSWSNWKIPTVFDTCAKSFPTWTGTININVCKGGLYKYVIIKDGRVHRWETGDNRTVETEFTAVDDGAFGDGGGNRKQLEANGKTAAKPTEETKSHGVKSPANGKCDAVEPEDSTPAATATTNGKESAEESATATQNGKDTKSSDTGPTKASTDKENKAPSPKDIAGDTTSAEKVAVAAAGEKVQGDTLTENQSNKTPAKATNDKMKPPTAATTTASPKTQTAGGKRKGKK